MSGIFCLLSSRDVAAILAPGGAIPARRYAFSTDVGLRILLWSGTLSSELGQVCLCVLTFPTQDTHIPP